MIYFGFFALEIVILYFFSNKLSNSLFRVFLKITKSQTVTITLLSVLFLPGIIIHELSHYLTAALLFVRTGEINFLPKKEDEGVRLGTVSIGKTDPIRRAIIGFAPAVFGTVALLSIVFLLSQNGNIKSFINADLKIQIPVYFLIGYMLFTVSNTMFTSKKDLEGTAEILIFFILISAGLFFAGVKIPMIFSEAIYNSGPLFKDINVFLLVPIGIDIIVYFFLKIFFKD